MKNLFIPSTERLESKENRIKAIQSLYLGIQERPTFENMAEAISIADARHLGSSPSNMTEQEFLNWLDTLDADNNDYAYWSTEVNGRSIKKKYKYNGETWNYEFDVVDSLDGVYTKDETDTLLANKQDNLEYDNAPTEDSTKSLTSGTVFTALEQSTSDCVKVSKSQNFNTTQKAQARNNIEALSESDNPIQYMAKLLVQQQQEIDGIKANIASLKPANATEYLTNNIPNILYSKTAGAPSSSITPYNWNTEVMGLWTGVPRFIGQIYIDKVNGKVYIAIDVTNSTSDWKLLN